MPRMDDPTRLDARELGRRWQAVLGRLELELNRHNFATWLAGTKARSFESGLLVVEARSAMAREWLDLRLRVVIERAASQMFGEVAVTFVMAGEEIGQRTTAVALSDAPRRTSLVVGQVNCALTFEDYLPTEGNQLALESCRAVADLEPEAASPVVLFGSPGMGKSHLLHALACRAKDSGRSVACLGAEEFANRYIAAIKAKRIEDFHEVVRTVDLLIIDDLQAIAGKRGTQEELVHTMDAVCNAGGHVVVASERHPFELGLPERLESRLAAGIITRVEGFGAGERRAFVEHVARRKRAALPSWAAERLAAVNAPSVRVLLGCINAAIALARAGKLDARALDASLAGVVVLDAATPNGEQELLERVARYFGVAVEELVGRSRTPRVSEARAAAIAGLKDRGYTLPRLAAVFGGRDKSTISTLAARGRGLLEEHEILRHLLAG